MLVVNASVVIGLDDFFVLLFFGGLVGSTFDAWPPLLTAFFCGSFTRHGQPKDKWVQGWTSSAILEINAAMIEDCRIHLNLNSWALILLKKEKRLKWVFARIRGERGEKEERFFACLHSKSFLDTSFFILELILLLQFQKKNLERTYFMEETNLSSEP